MGGPVTPEFLKKQRNLIKKMRILMEQDILSADRISEECDVQLGTITRWLNGSSNGPRGTRLELLELLIDSSSGKSSTNGSVKNLTNGKTQTRTQSVQVIEGSLRIYVNENNEVLKWEEA